MSLPLTGPYVGRPSPQPAHGGSQAVTPQGGSQSVATTWGGGLWTSGEPLVPDQHVCGIPRDSPSHSRRAGGL